MKLDLIFLIRFSIARKQGRLEKSGQRDTSNFGEAENTVVITVTAVPINPIPITWVMFYLVFYIWKIFCLLLLSYQKVNLRTISFVYVVHSRIYSVQKGLFVIK